MNFTRADLAERLADADRALRTLRRATLDMQALGAWVKGKREADRDGRSGPDRARARSG